MKSKTKGSTEPSKTIGVAIYELIEAHSLNQTHLALKMGMPPSTFKNKLSEKRTAYRFSQAEHERLRGILMDIASNITNSLQSVLD